MDPHDKVKGFGNPYKRSVTDISKHFVAGHLLFPGNTAEHQGQKRSQEHARQEAELERTAVQQLREEEQKQAEEKAKGESKTN